MCFRTIKNIFSAGWIILKVLLIIGVAVALWFIINKLGILSPIKSILKAVFTGVKGVFSFLGFG